MRSQLLRVLQAGRIAAAVQELGAASGIAPCALQALASRNPQVPGADASAKAGRGAPERLPAFSSAASGRFISTSASASAEALTATPVEGDVAALIKELDSVLSSEACTAKEVADAAVSLAYLQAKGNRRIWGKVFEKASALKGSFDATSLANFLWATSAASVDHFKTVYELAGPAAGFTKSFSAKQLSFVVEALGRAGVNDAELFAGLAGAVQAKMGELSPADLCRVLYGMAASGVPDVATAKAVATAVVGKADGLAVTQLAQLSWALAEARIADRPLLDGVARALKAKLPAVESAQEAAAIALAMGSLGVSDPELASKAAAAVKASAPGLTTPQMVHAAWGLSTLGSTDKEAFSTLFKGISAGMDAKLDAVDVKTAAMLHEVRWWRAAREPCELPAQCRHGDRKLSGVAFQWGSRSSRRKPRSAAIRAPCLPLLRARAHACLPPLSSRCSSAPPASRCRRCSSHALCYTRLPPGHV